MAQISRTQIKQRIRESELARMEHDAKKKSLRSADHQFHITISRDDFIYPEMVGASTMVEAIAKVTKRACRQWRCKESEVVCTNAEMVR